MKRPVSGTPFRVTLTPCAKAVLLVASEPSRRLRSLLVALDNLGSANTRRPRVATGLAQGSALSQQIPALIEPDLDRLESAVLALAQPALGATLIELVLFGDQLLDAVVECFVFHFHLPGTSLSLLRRRFRRSRLDVSGARCRCENVRRSASGVGSLLDSMRDRLGPLTVGTHLRSRSLDVVRRSPEMDLAVFEERPRCPGISVERSADTTGVHQQRPVRPRSPKLLVTVTEQDRPSCLAD